MNEFFFKAKEGSEEALKKIYASVIRRIYDSVFFIFEDEKKSAEISEALFIYAFSSASDFDEFFDKLNSKLFDEIHTDSGTELIHIEKIEKSDITHEDLENQPIPESLKKFGEKLISLLSYSADEAKGEIKDSAEDILHEFYNLTYEEKEIEIGNDDGLETALTGANPESESKKSKIRFFTQKTKKLFHDDLNTALLDESPEAEKPQLETNTKGIVVASILILMLVIMAVSVYFIARRADSPLHKVFFPETSSSYTTQAETTAKTYNPNQINEAFTDYYNNVLLKKYGSIPTERIVAYNENGKLGADKFNGLLSAQILDADGDGRNEMLCIHMLTDAYTSSLNQTAYSISFFADIYEFESGKVKETAPDNYIMSYTADGVYTPDALQGDFTFSVKIMPNKNDLSSGIYFEFKGGDFTKCRLSEYKNEQFNTVCEYFSYTWEKENFLYAQLCEDGTYEALFGSLAGAYAQTIADIDDFFMERNEKYGITYASESIHYSSYKALRNHIDKSLKNWELKTASDIELLSFSDSKKGSLLTRFLSKEDEEDGIYRTVFQLKDYSQAEDLKNGKIPAETKISTNDTTTKKSTDKKD